MIKRIVHIILLSCRNATVLIEKKLHTRLSRRERVQLKWHKSICDACTLYEKQVIFIERVLREDLAKTPAEYTFPAETIAALKARIAQKLEK